jgi:hypothetical protein
MKIQYVGSDEFFAAPVGYSEKDAVSWAARLYHSSCYDVKETSPHVWRVSNRRRGVSARGTIITVSETE